MGKAPVEGHELNNSQGSPETHVSSYKLEWKYLAEYLGHSGEMQNDTP